MPRPETLYLGGFPVRLARLKEMLKQLPEAEATKYFQLDSRHRPLKTTVSLCAECLNHVPAIVFTEAGRVLIRKDCLRHGLSDALLESDEHYYFLSNKDQWGLRFVSDRNFDFPEFAGSCCEGGSCGGAPEESDFFTDQMGNKTCTILVEVTNACNLACQVCYSDAKGDRKMPLEQFKAYLLQLIEKKGGLDSVQLTGGEAVLHPEFWEMVEFLYEQGAVKKIYLPTNGILFTKEENARRLEKYREKIMVLLQFDAQNGEANRKLRDANPTRIRDEVIARLDAGKIPMQLTMTIAKGINDEEIGWVVDTGAKHSNIRVIALQPVTYSGRYDQERDPLNRLTLSDIAKAVIKQSRLRMKAEDFVPVPCSHPNCGWLTLFVRRWGLMKNIVSYVDLQKSLQTVANKAMLSTEELRNTVAKKEQGLFREILSLVGKKIIRSTDIFTIAVKPFMDRFSYDQDRISSCCHHTMDTQGNTVSFCEYNALLRPRDAWESFPKMGAP